MWINIGGFLLNNNYLLGIMKSQRASNDSFGVQITYSVGESDYYHIASTESERDKKYDEFVKALRSNEEFFDFEE